MTSDLPALPGLTIRAAAALLRAGSCTSVDLTEAVLARLAATEPHIHAYALVNAESARAAAAIADRELRAGVDRGPLHGISVGVKDVIDIAGLPTRCGSASRADAAPAVRDAAVVARLRAAGAVIVGKTVTHEFAAGVTSPPARNPWDPDRIPGGSSGGSAAAVATGSALAALGADTAGSIRIPAALVGAVGLKPTYGGVSRDGVFPLSWTLDTVGPLATTVDDAQTVFEAIREPARPPSPANGDSLAGVRIGVARPYFFDRLQPDVASAVEQAIRLLGDLGATVIDVDWPDAAAAAAVGFVICRPELAAVHEQTLRTTPERFGPVLRARLEAFTLFPAAGYLRGRRAQIAVQRSIASLYRRHDLAALVTPTVPATATSADAATIVYPDGDEPVHSGFTRFTMPFNATGQPALSIPVGFDRIALPIGLQIVGRPHDEATVCRIGRACETATAAARRWPVL